jgi:hypothetical protein
MRGLGNYQISVPKRPVGSEDRNLLAFQNNNFWFYRDVPVPVQSLVKSNGENSVQTLSAHMNFHHLKASCSRIIRIRGSGSVTKPVFRIRIRMLWASWIRIRLRDCLFQMDPVPAPDPLVNRQKI